MAKSSLYERVGGDEGVESVLYDFYRRVFADAELAPFFEGIDAERLRRMQHEFFAAALGGELQYTGRPLAEIHGGLGIETRHLRRFVDHLMATLVARSIDESDRYEVCSRINTYADEITGSIPTSG